MLKVNIFFGYKNNTRSIKLWNTVTLHARLNSTSNDVLQSMKTPKIANLLRLISKTKAQSNVNGYPDKCASPWILSFFYINWSFVITTLLCHQIAENVKFTSLISRDRKEIEMSNLDNYNAHVVGIILHGCCFWAEFWNYQFNFLFFSSLDGFVYCY